MTRLRLDSDEGSMDDDFIKTIRVRGIDVRTASAQGERPDWIEPTMMRMILDAGRIRAVEHQRALMARSVFYNAVTPCARFSSATICC